MPDSSRSSRRWTAARLLTRGFSHLIVAGLVVFVAVMGVTQNRGSGAATQGSNFSLIANARAGGTEADPLRSATFEIVPHPQDDPELLTRNAPSALPPPSALPTPVPVDPNATPLPAPTTLSIGTTQRAVQAGPAPVAPVGGRLEWPVPGGTITQYFHAAHLALDIAGPSGSMVVTAEAGVVTSAGWRNNGGGLVVTVDHGNGMSTVYNHLGQIWVTSGQAVARGDSIGSVGCTGLCTGPHVHFEVIVNGLNQNPVRYL